MAVSREEVERIARLARLSLTQEELVRFEHELNQILEYVGQVQQAETSGVSAELDPERHENVLREDVVRPSLPRDEALKNAPDTDGVHFRVPPVLPSTEH
jgi:aspartyl-tRNA(Asn)/glutamyl-tRNA(Gln) amidotransferase subunit C